MRSRAVLVFALGGALVAGQAGAGAKSLVTPPLPLTYCRAAGLSAKTGRLSYVDLSNSLVVTAP